MMQSNAEQMLAAASDADAAQVVVAEMKMRTSRAHWRRGRSRIPSRRSRGGSSRPEIFLAFPEEYMRHKEMQINTEQLMQTAVAAIRAEVMAGHSGIASQFHKEVLLESQPGSEIPRWTTNQLQSQT